MQDFLKAIDEVKMDIVSIKLGIQDINLIKKCVLISLKIKSENELRDKFEGVAFYQNFHRKILGIIALEKKLKLKLVDWDTIEPKDYSPTINLFGKQVYVQTTDFGELPQIKTDLNYPIIFTIKKDERTIWIIGFSIGLKEIKCGTLSTFKNLTSFSNAEELKRLLI